MICNQQKRTSMSHSKIHHILVSFLLLSVLSSAAKAQLITGKITSNTFAFFETTSASLVVEGVSSPYRMGAIGAEIHIPVLDKYKLSAGFGYGYAPNQLVSFSEANFKGDISSIYTRLGVERDLFRPSKTTDVSVLFDIEAREVSGESLIGSRRGTALNRSLQSKLKSQNLMIKASKSLLKQDFEISVGFGLSKWNFSGKGKAQQPSGISEINKTAKANGIDPFAELNLHLIKNNFEYDLGIRRGRISADDLVWLNRLSFSISKNF